LQASGLRTPAGDRQRFAEAAESSYLCAFAIFAAQISFTEEPYASYPEQGEDLFFNGRLYIVPPHAAASDCV
jgi:hypothetical protein